MRTFLLASASLLLIGGTAVAQNSSSPMSNTAAHTSSADTRGSVAPRLPISAEDASADQFLMHAQSALRRGRTGEAQEALERAETRLLDRSTTPAEASMADTDPRVASVRDARQALGRGDRAGAMRDIQTAMAMPATAAMPGNTMSHTMPANGMSDANMSGGPPMQPYDPAAIARSTGVPPNSLGGISNSVSGDGGSGAGTGSRPQASFSGPSPSNVVPPNSLGGISNSVSGDGGSGAGTGSRPQAGFSGPSGTGETVPSPSGNAGAVQTP